MDLVKVSDQVCVCVCVFLFLSTNLKKNRCALWRSATCVLNLHLVVV